MKILPSKQSISAILVLCMIHTSIARRLLVSQSQPEPTRPPVMGVFGQDCTPPFDDNPPDNCASPGDHLYAPTGKVECAENFDCCLCQMIKCGYDQDTNGHIIPCDEFHVNGDSGAFGVKHIDILGDTTTGAVINCGGDLACKSTQIYGMHIASIQCAGDSACEQSQWDIECLSTVPCSMRCVGDKACAGSTEIASLSSFVISNSAGLSCADDACKHGTFIMRSNIGGESVLCHGESACINAQIVIDNILQISCGGTYACKGASIRVVDPKPDFSLDCNAMGSCEGMDLEIIITEKSSVDFFKGFNCNGRGSCAGAMVTVINNGANFITIENLECRAFQACKLTHFELVNAAFVNCQCGSNIDQSCEGTTGIDTCFSGLDKLECYGTNSCQGTTESLTNVADGFELICGSISSCEAIDLTILINDNNEKEVSTIKGYNCNADESCNGASVGLVNKQKSASILIEKIECGGINSCANAHFGCTGDVRIGSIVCGGTGSCDGCIVIKNDGSKLDCSQSIRLMAGLMMLFIMGLANMGLSFGSDLYCQCDASGLGFCDFPPDNLHHSFWCPNDDRASKNCSAQIRKAEVSGKNPDCSCLDTECILSPLPAVNASCISDLCWEGCWSEHQCGNMDDGHAECVYFCMNYCVDTYCNPLFPMEWTKCESGCTEYIKDDGPIDATMYADCMYSCYEKEEY